MICKARNNSIFHRGDIYIILLASQRVSESASRVCESSPRVESASRRVTPISRAQKPYCKFQNFRPQFLGHFLGHLNSRRVRESESLRVGESASRRVCESESPRVGEPANQKIFPEQKRYVVPLKYTTY